jgi:toxin ParE1/3/4
LDFQIVYTEPALADLEAILDWSLSAYPDGTNEFAQGLLRHIRLVNQFPLMGERVKGRAHVRRIHHTPFDVYYRAIIERQRVEILHIWHAKRQPPEL